MSIKNNDNIITIGSNVPLPGQTKPTTIIITQAQRFGIDIETIMRSIRSFENVDYTRRSRLYDLYDDIMIDGHLISSISKRRKSILKLDVEFHRDGKRDEALQEMINSPWFSNFVKDVIDAQFYGSSLMQFYKDGDWLNYDLIPRKHYDPIRRTVLCRQTDITGTSWDDYTDLLFVGDKRDLGLLGPASFYVTWKRNSIGDWAQFSEVFGMPIRDYIYDDNDDEARQRILDDAMQQGANACYIHPKSSELNLREAGNKTGSSDVYHSLADFCNAEMSKMFLGNTLTTEATNKGTQALGKVHKESESDYIDTDKKYVMNVLNYNMSDIWQSMGIDLTGGKFVFIEKASIEPKDQIEIVAKLDQMGLPMDDDYLYETFNIKKPINYDALKQKKEDERLAAIEAAKQAKADNITDPVNPVESPKPPTPPAPPIPPIKELSTTTPKEPATNSTLSKFFNHLKSFFVTAPENNGAQMW